MQPRTYSITNVKNELVETFSFSTMPVVVVAIMADFLICPKEYVIAHSHDAETVGGYLFSLLQKPLLECPEEKEPQTKLMPTNIATTLNELSDNAREKLLNNWKQNQPLLYAYFAPISVWSKDFRTLLKANYFNNESKDVMPAAIRQTILIKSTIHQGQSPVKLLAAKVPHVNLSHTDFKAGDYTEGNFAKVNLFRAKLNKTKLYFAEFSDADLTDAECLEADIPEIKFNEDTKLFGINLRGVVTDDSVKKALLSYILKMELPEDHLCYAQLQQLKLKCQKTSSSLFKETKADAPNAIDDCIAFLWALGAKNEEDLKNRLKA